MLRHRPKWTRGAFIHSLPKRCLKCYREGVTYKDRKLVRSVPGYQTTLVHMTATCMHRDCGAVFAQQPSDGPRYGTGFMCGRTEVVFVDTLPYHVSLGGRVAKILAEGNFAKP